MTDAVASMAQAAAAAANQGRWSEAHRLWLSVLAREPRHAQALFSLGVHAFRDGQLAEANRLLQAAREVAPREPSVLLALGVVRRELGDDAGELAAIEAALVVDPLSLQGLLAKGMHLERTGRRREAAVVYGNALKAAPPEAHWPPSMRESLVRARELVQRQGEELAAFLATRVGDRFGALTASEAERWREACAVLSGQGRSYPSVCSRLQVPRLPAIPFFDRSLFPWAEALEAQTAVITAELGEALAQEGSEFRPYVAYEPGAPVNQWHELNHSPRWSSYFLWRNGAPVLAHQLRCPKTTAALAAVPMADIGGLCPNAMFSALAPRTRIPPHHGETNARLVVHLPLVVPEGCSYRVGFEHRRWKVGEILAFDDSIEHEARNDGDELRVVLIFDVWNPLLSAGERDMVRALSAATGEFLAQR
jgi:aspartyl/asparaginyl beta-hydroxylase (cupin superfamily)